MEIEAEFPEKLQFLFEPSRYKVAYGGRGSGKSWGYARALIIRAIESPVRLLCAREVQKSIKQSVHTLLTDQIKMMGLRSQFDILETEIRGKNGSLITFTGLSQHTVDSIKSIEGTDICWVEEGQTVSKRSWEILIPTIRKTGSEIWVTFNPELESDDTYQRFVVNAQKDSKVVKVNWSDNPWFPEVLRAEMEHLKEVDIEAYKNVWEGECKYIINGAIYKDQIEKAKADDRITGVPYDPSLKVHTVWDIGVGDSTSIWFAQQYGKEIRIIDYYEASGEGLPHYAKVLQDRAYLYGRHIGPHDIQVREFTSGRSRIDTAASLGINFEICPNISLEDGIHAVRMMFPRMWFDEKKTKRGMDCLCNYRWSFNDKMGEFKSTPVHDWASHGADSLRYLAIALPENRGQSEKIKRRVSLGGSGGWMGA